MSRHLIAVEIDGTIMTLRGWKAHSLALGAGLRPTYNGVHQGWVADTKRLGDLLAYCESRGVSVEIAEETVQRVGFSTEVESPCAQLDLFGDEELPTAVDSSCGGDAG